MKKTIKKIAIGTFIFGSIYLGVGINSVEAATPAWPSPAWYAQFYQQQNTQQEPTGNTSVKKENTDQVVSEKPTTRPTNNYWSNPALYYSKLQENANSTTPTTGEKESVSSVALTSQEQQLLNLVNTERKNKGLSELKVDSELTKWARIKSQDMVDNNYFAHESPTYGKASQMLKNAGLSFRYVGENLAKVPSVNSAHQKFMNSSVHRANILHSAYTKVGIGIKYKGSTLYITQLFAAE